MATDMATLAAGATASREVPHTVSPSLWILAWRRLRQDRVAMVSMAIVGAFLVMIVLSATGLIAADWSREAGVNYAPPTFMGPDASSAQKTTEATVPASEGETLASTYHSTIVDPLADVLAQIRGEARPAAPAAGAPAASDTTVDPLADVMADIRAGAGATAAVTAAARGHAAVRRRQVGPRRAEEDDQGLGDVDHRRHRVGDRRHVPRHAVRRARRLLRAAGSTTSSTGSTASSARSRTCC